MPRLANTRSRLVLSLALAFLTLAAYEGVRHCGFVGFDDNLLVYRNPHLRGGLTWSGVRWALGADLLFDSQNADYWTPLTALSRLLDVQLFGLEPAGHHLTNLLLHGMGVLLLFHTLSGMTGAVGRSAFVAGLMAVHPLHVESVAWVTERKDVLSGVFFVLTLAAYARYVRAPQPARLATVVVAHALGLLSKPMLITTPFVLLLLDYWPLGRLKPGPGAAGLGRLVREKWPLFLLSLASAAATFVPLLRGGRLDDLEELPFGARVGNALLAYWTYIRQTFWPHPLAIPYPHPGRVPPLEAAAAGLALAVITAAALRTSRLRPWFIVGWLWFLGMLVPVSGLVQSGEHSHADRYTYLPSIGLSLLIAWGAAEGISALGAARLLPPLALAALVACVPLTRRQVSYWQSTVTLFSHSVAVTAGNALAHRNLAAGLALQGDLAGGERHYREAIRIRPDYWRARAGLGVLLLGQGRLPEAVLEQQQALRQSPASPEVNFNLGAALARMGRGAEAAAHYAEAVRLRPGFAAAHYNWGNLLAAQGRWPEAEACYAAAVRLAPEDVEARNNLGLSVGLQGRWAEAAAILGSTLALDPSHTRARINLARALRELGRAAEARVELEGALRRSPGNKALQEALQELPPP